MDPDAPTDDEMEGINNIVKETGIVKALKVQGDEHQERITDIKYHLENQVKGLNAHLSSMIGKLEAQEEEMTEQLKRLEELTGHHLSHVQKEHELAIMAYAIFNIDYFNGHLCCIFISQTTNSRNKDYVACTSLALMR